MPTSPATPKNEPSISIVLPAYDEELCIGQAVGQALEFLSSHFAHFEVIVVDDGSRDGTARVVRRLAAENPALRLIQHQGNQGYGRAIASGFAEAQYELIFFTDADNQFDIRELVDFIPLMRDHDAVFGYRIYRYDSVTRCLLSWVYNRLVRILFRIRVRDVDCSFKLFKKEVIDRITIECDDFFVDTELVARVAKLNCRTTERGVRHYPRTAGRTTVRPGHIPRTLWTLTRMWFRVNFGMVAKEHPKAAARSEAVKEP